MGSEKNLDIAKAYAEEMRQVVCSMCEDVEDSSSMTEAWKKIDRCYETLERLRNQSPCTGSKSFSLRSSYENEDEQSFPGHTKYLQGLDLPIMVNCILPEDSDDDLYPSDTAEMRIGDWEGRQVLLVTPEVLSPVRM